jgi:hypothetical protein
MASREFVQIPFLYREGGFENTKAPLRRYRYADEDVPLFFGTDEKSGNPDWLGEIFVWLSGGQELSAHSRDGLGRIPYSETTFAQHNLSPRKPYAALLMAWFENVLRNGTIGKQEALPKAPSPTAEANHLVICSHDIDFYFVSRSACLARLVKNLALALSGYRSRSFFVDNLELLLRLCRGNEVGNFLPELLARAQGEWDFRSSLFVVPRRSHRRDPNYTLSALAPHLLRARKAGFSVELHGSYRSVIEERTLSQEARVLSLLLGETPYANRQHWLRFGEHRTLFNEIERAGLICDSTAGFSETVGFRNGACFAFPPYDFASEKPHDFLEIPLILMDVSLSAAARALRTAPQCLVDEVLGESRKRGWGGVSILWHNPVEPVQVPREINRVFWTCAKQQKRMSEKWMSVPQFLGCSLERFHRAQLLQRVSLQAVEQHGNRGLRGFTCDTESRIIQNMS